MKKVFLLNFPQDDDSFFGDELHDELQKLAVPTQRGWAEDFLLDLGNGKDIRPNIVLGDDILDIAGAVFFMKKRENHNRYFSTLLSKYVELLGARQLNPLFKQHHKNISKFSEAINLVKNGYRIPRTLLVHESKYVAYRSYIEKQLTYPFVLKAGGSGGKAVWKIESFDAIEQVLKEVDAERTEVLAFQEYVKSSAEEFRVVLFGGEVVSLVRRSSDDFYNNAAQGGTVSTAELSEEEIRVCKEVAKISGLDYLAVDFMRGEDGALLFIELQTGPSMTVSKTAEPQVIQNIAAVIKKMATDESHFAR